MSMSWREVDDALRGLAERRGQLDAEELVWLRAAVRTEVWTHLGYATIHEYLERALGYAARTARDRVRVAEALGELPLLSAALADGRLSFCAVRELVRVADPDNEAEWLEDARGKSVRQIQDRVAGRRHGDRPTDAPDPTLDRQRLVFEVTPETFALFRQAQQVLEAERGEPLDDDALIAELARAALVPAASTAPDSDRPLHQIATTVCERCERGWRDGGGVTVELPRPAVERAACDADRIGSIDADPPARRTSDIPPATRRQVRARFHHRCAVPGCRLWRYQDIHHVVPRADGGGHELTNLCNLCDLHHRRAHAGALIIRTTPGGFAFFHADGRPYGAHPAETAPRDPSAPPPSADHRSSPSSSSVADVEAALRRTGFDRKTAAAAVARAVAHVGHDAGVEPLLVRSFQEAGRLASGP